MAELLLTQAVNQAEQAIETGNYGGAIQTCQRILGEFPEFARAHRILAEAYAEQGDTEAARDAYQRTLERDPQSIPAHLGLAMIAEEAGELEGALAHYQVSWEIDPRRRDLREHVSRISQQLYGDGGRLYLTRAALTSLHFHAGRWDRAVSEGAQVLQELNQRVDVQIRMAEALWRRGDDEEARQVCTKILRTLPSAVVPLLILADIHRRQSNEGVAADMLEQARAIDPDGVRAADLVMVGLDDQADFLSVEDIPTIEERVLTEEPATRYAPAPDFIGGDEDEIEPPAPAQPEAPAASGGPPQQDEAIPGAEPAQSGDELTPDPGLQPFRWEDLGDIDLESSDIEAGTGQEESDLSGLLDQDVPAEPAEQDEDDISLDLFTDEEIEQARPSDDQAAGYTGMLQSLDSEGMRPFDPSGGWDEAAGSMGPETPEEVVGEFGQDPFQPEAPAEPTADLSDQSDVPQPESTGEGDPFDVDWSQVDAEIEDARPGDIPRGYTDELRTLDDIGVEPFSIEDREAEGDAEIAPEDTDNLDDLLSDQPAAGPAAEAPQPEEPATGEPDLDALTRDLDAAAGETPPGERETAADEEALDDEVAEAERAGALESLEELFGDYEAQTFQEESDRTAELDAFDLSDLEPADGGMEPSAEGTQPESDEAAGLVPYEPSMPETREPVADAEVFGEPIQPHETAEMGPAEQAASAAGPIGAGASLESFEISAERLGFGEDLLERARSAKQELMRRGLVEGSQPLPGAGVSLDTLRGEVERDPRNVDHRVALAAALIEEDPDEALEQYRWLYRHAPERATEIVDDLTRLIEVMSERQVGAHRLLAAVYRRHGDWRLAATHYEESLVRSRSHLR